MIFDFLRDAVVFLITPFFAARSMTEAACRTAASCSSGFASFTRRIAVATLDFSARFLARAFSLCLRDFFADFLCAKWKPPAVSRLLREKPGAVAPFSFVFVQTLKSTKRHGASQGPSGEPPRAGAGGAAARPGPVDWRRRRV